MAEYAQTADAAPNAEHDRDSKPWLDMLDEAKRCDQKYNDKCDNIDKLYADLDALAKESTDRQFQIFWANLEVLKPSIYSRPPVPVVVPRFKDRKELPRRASEVLERCLISSFESDDIDATMRLVRDDLATNARGVIWCRLEQSRNEDGSVAEKVCKEHLDRKDFRHGAARKWAEVPWVAKRTWPNRKKGMKRFGDIFLKVELAARKDDTAHEYSKEKVGEVWELWHKETGLVVWVSPGVDEVLDIRPAFLKLDGFFPCPRPAYGTLKRGTLTPVPDFLYYKDQVEEINELTARISSLSESLRLKGFYPGGASDVGDAIETVLKDQSNNATLVPINGLAMFGDKSLKDSIVWLPVKDVAEVISQLVELRRQLIDDVYQITGLSDIMRGSTEASETATAQRIKSQYGSIRIRDKQNELVRLARDVTRIEAEIMAENFAPQTLLDMSQVDDLPTDQQVAQQIAQITEQITLAAADPVVRQQAQTNPEQAKQMLQQAQAQVENLQAQVTLEKVVALLREQRIRPFVLEIETDSTIQPDEDAAKQRATEFITAVGGYMQQAVAAVTTVPQMAPLATTLLKYVASQFRAGREVDQAIDAFADQMKQMAAQPKPPSPEQIKAESEAKAREQEAQLKQQEAQNAEAQSQRDAVQAERDAQIKADADARQAAHDERMAAMDERLKQMDLILKALDLKITQEQAAQPKEAA